MCGIAGYWVGNNGKVTREIAAKMAEMIAHRGSDAADVWIDEESGLAFAHRRLSIIDLSEAGHQPMVSPCGRFVLTFNGEIYNHQDLRKELEMLGVGLRWRGHSDTETLLAVFMHWGIEDGLKRLNGMFAFGLWDRTEKTLCLARDRTGEKPLYYGRNGNTFLFGSELKAMTAHPAWRGEINRDGVALFMRHNCIPTPYSIYKDIYKLPPAHFIIIRDDGLNIKEPICYWDIKSIAEKGVENCANIDDSEKLVGELDKLLLDAVGIRMEADVPLGAFLSGGYDSTTVTAMMQAQSEKPVKTFTIGFHEDGYNEAEHAKAVASYLKTDHTELYVSSEEAMAVVPKLASIWDEPFSDSSQISTYLVNKLARNHVTVCLSGDGGDELFGGYTRYFVGGKVGAKLTQIPLRLRSIFARMLENMPAHTLNKIGTSLPGALKHQALGDKIHKLAEVLELRDGDDFYHGIISHWKDPASVVLGAVEPQTIFSNRKEWPQLLNLVERMMYFDTVTYLPDDILTKVDRASMAVTLEARVPMLDHRVVEFAWNTPTSMKIHKGQGKWLLKQVLYRYVPKELMDRPKMGFGVPIEHWLRGPLREWAEELIDEKRLQDEGFFEPKIIRKRWSEHLSGERRWHYYLWDVLMFQAWHEQYKHTFSH